MHPVHFPLRHLARGCSAALLGMFGLAGGAVAGAGGPANDVPPAAVAGPAYWPPETGRELLAVDEPMRRFFSARVSRRHLEGEQLRQIVEAIVRPEGLHFAYEAEGTYDSREAFRRRRGNCVAFAFLVAAVAREYGLEVQFQEADTFQQWNRFERFLAAIRHTNLRMETRGSVYVVDLRPDFAPKPVSDNRYVVSDERAAAHFYSTAGFFRLVNGDAAGAMRLMQLATGIDPRSRIVWANLGNVHLQRDELGPARTCFERSLQLDPRGELALAGLVEVLRRQGGAEEVKLADKYERRAQALRVRNPYYHYNLAVLAGTGGDWAAAEKCLRQAIRLKDDDPVFHEQLVVVLHRLGRTDEARREEERLESLRARQVVTTGHLLR